MKNDNFLIVLVLAGAGFAFYMLRGGSKAGLSSNSTGTQSNPFLFPWLQNKSGNQPQNIAPAKTVTGPSDAALYTAAGASVFDSLTRLYTQYKGNTTTYPAATNPQPVVGPDNQMFVPGDAMGSFYKAA